MLIRFLLFWPILAVLSVFFFFFFWGGGTVHFPRCRPGGPRLHSSPSNTPGQLVALSCLIKSGMTWCVEKVQRWRHLGAPADTAPFHFHDTICNCMSCLADGHVQSSYIKHIVYTIYWSIKPTLYNYRPSIAGTRNKIMVQYWHHVTVLLSSSYLGSCFLKGATHAGSKHLIGRHFYTPFFVII